MKKNRLPKDAVLANILLNPRSSAYRQLCATCSDENQLQSDEAGARLRDEVKAVVTDLLKGNYESVEAKLNEHCSGMATHFRVRPFSTQKSKIKVLRDAWSIEGQRGSLNAHLTKVRLSDRHAWFIEEQPDTVTPEQRVYRLLRETLKSGEIDRFALCKSKDCQQLFFRKSLKGVFCSDHCRAMHHFYE